MAGPRRPIVWSPEARADLISGTTMQGWPAEAPPIIFRRIGDACRLLEDHPYGGRARDEIRQGLRSVVATPHVIFYRLVENDAACVVRVIDGRRDIEEIFADDADQA